MSVSDTQPIIDLRMCHAIYRAGSISVFLTWTLTDGEPCIVLVPANNPLSHERVTPCIVPLASAHRWDEKHGEGAMVDMMAGEFCAHLGLNPVNRADVHRVQSIVRDFLGDMISMPPMPDHIRRKVADMFVTDNATGKTIHREISDSV